MVAITVLLTPALLLSLTVYSFMDRRQHDARSSVARQIIIPLVGQFPSGDDNFPITFVDPLDFPGLSTDTPCDKEEAAARDDNIDIVLSPQNY